MLLSAVYFLLLISEFKIFVVLVSFLLQEKCSIRMESVKWCKWISSLFCCSSTFLHLQKFKCISWSSSCLKYYDYNILKNASAKQKRNSQEIHELRSTWRQFLSITPVFRLTSVFFSCVGVLGFSQQ